MCAAFDSMLRDYHAPAGIVNEKGWERPGGWLAGRAGFRPGTFPDQHQVALIQVAFKSPRKPPCGLDTQTGPFPGLKKSLDTHSSILILYSFIVPACRGGIFFWGRLARATPPAFVFSATISNSNSGTARLLG